MIKNTFLLFLLGFILPQLILAQNITADMHVQDLEGNEVSLTDYVKEGQITLLSFWATWCAPCKKELDHLSSHYDSWKEKYNIEVVAVSTDQASKLEKVISTAEEKNWPFSVLIDPNNTMYEALDFQSVPQIFLIDETGKIVFKRTGYKEEDKASLEEEIKKLIK